MFELAGTKTNKGCFEYYEIELEDIRLTWW